LDVAKSRDSCNGNKALLVVQLARVSCEKTRDCDNNIFLDISTHNVLKIFGTDKQ
jgi:hypothetical protein